jgi:xanthine/CO dehydrogenase XdhC/CoxF family maturation factor
LSKEIKQIIEKLNSLDGNETAILATVVDVEGSGYRRPGARMLIDRDGFGIGTVSGGCLEADVLERAKRVFASGEPTVITYDTTKEENSVFGLGMGCRGVVRILLETISKNSFWLNFAADSIADGTPFSTATLIDSNGAQPLGARFYFTEYGSASSEFGESETTELFPVMRRALLERRTAVERRAFGEVFIETVLPPVNLVLFGAGYDAVPLVRFAKELGWRVTVIDHRAGYAKPERFPEADEIRVSRIQDFSAEFFEDANAVAVVMTHNYDRDREILPRLLRSHFFYVGALGPKKRTEKILAEADERFSAEELKKLHAPVGLDIGADTPEAIALAIAAEINAVLKSRAGGFLRERNGSIYERQKR